MPTRIGQIWAQFGDDVFSGGLDFSVTVNPSNRDITAHAALSHYSTTKNDHFGEAGIIRVISNGQVTNFEDPRPHVQRDNVSQVRFRVNVNDCFVRVHLGIDYWQ